MKIFSLITVALLGISSLCGAEPAADQDPPAPEITGPGLEFQWIGQIQDLMVKVFAKMEVTEGVAATNLILGAMNTATANGRRSLEGLEPTEILGESATAAIEEAATEWLSEFQAGSGRKLQLSNDDLIVLNIVKAVSCIILSIFIDNIMYSQVEDLADYEDNIVCIKEGFCPFVPPVFDVKNLKFVSKHAKGGEFLYHDKGPKQLQGVFWLYYEGYCSSIVSFAETVEEFPLSTGELREPALPLFPFLPDEFTYDGFTYNIRVSGASNWAFAQRGFGPTTEFPGNLCYDAVEAFDLIYGIKPLDTFNAWWQEEPFDIDDPKAFVIVPSIKIPFLDLRVSIDSECTEDIIPIPSEGVFPFSLLRFEMHLIEDCNDIIDDGSIPSGETAFDACRDGNAVIWERRTFVLTSRFGPPSSIYYVIQIVDGCGEKVEVAYDDWEGYHGFGSPQPYINHFRSLDSKAAKSSKSAKEAKSGKVCKKGYYAPTYN